MAYKKCGNLYTARAFPCIIYISTFFHHHDLYSSPSIVRAIKLKRMGWAENVARMGERIGVCRVLVGRPEGKRPFGRPTRRWNDNIKTDLQEVGCGGYGMDRAGSG